VGERGKKRFAGFLAFSFASFLLGVDKRKEDYLRIAIRLTRVSNSNATTNNPTFFLFFFSGKAGGAGGRQTMPASARRSRLAL